MHGRSPHVLEHGVDERSQPQLRWIHPRSNLMSKINKEQHPMPTQIFSYYNVYVIWMTELELPVLSEEKWDTMSNTQLEKYIYTWMEKRQNQRDKHRDELTRQERTFKPHQLVSHW